MWSSQYVENAIASAPLSRPIEKYFSPDGDDSAGDGSVSNPWKSLAKANDYLNSTGGNVRLRFRKGGVWRETNGLQISKPHVTVDGYRAAPDPMSAPKPVFSKFLVPFEPAQWATTAHAGTYVTTVSGPVAWAKFWNDEETVLRRMTSVEDCYATEGSWFNQSGVLYVHTFQGNDLTTGIVKIEAVLMNTLSGITVGDVPDVRIDGIRVEGYGAGSPGDHSYNGYAIESNASGSNRTVITECECSYNGRHNIAKVGSGTGGSLVVAYCRVGWLVNDDICVVSYAPQGGQELVSAYNEFLGGELPDTNTPYESGASDAANYTHTTNDFIYRCGFMLCIGNKLETGPYMCGNVSYTTCAPSYTDPAQCRAFVLAETAVSRTPNAFDSTKPSPTNKDGHIFYRLGSAYTTYISCKVTPTLLWTTSSGDIPACTSSEGTWINSDITFDFRQADLSSWDRVLSVSPVQPGFSFFTSSFYGCRLTFRGRPGGMTGFSGPMLHKYGTYFKSAAASWFGEISGCIVSATGLGDGQFQLGFGNSINKLKGNAYYGISDESGAWGCDQDSWRVRGGLFSGVPPRDATLQLPGMMTILGYKLEYDRSGAVRPPTPTVGPIEPSLIPQVRQPFDPSLL